MSILLTGAAGFIGYHVAEGLLARGERVIGLDNLNPYYDVRLKRARLERLAARPGFTFHQVDIADADALGAVLRGAPEVTRMIHLAAQAGVRHSLVDPGSYVQSNVVGHLNLLEAARRLPRLEHLVYASSSSVYGANQQLPYSERDRVDEPLSLYAATKRADELMSHAYAHLFGIPQTGLRFFTVYGPWGRPDMAYFGFARAILAGEPIILYEDGRLRRDFTYIDDIVAGVLGALDRPPNGRPPVRLLNIGNNHNEPVARLVELLEAGLGKRALVRSAPRPAADVAETAADIDSIHALTGFSPHTPLSEGIPHFVAWFRAWNARTNQSNGEPSLRV